MVNPPGQDEEDERFDRDLGEKVKKKRGADPGENDESCLKREEVPRCLIGDDGKNGR
jgi:hypothetical protein